MEKAYKHSSDFSQCGICSSSVAKLEFDSPLYCEACIAEMEKLSLSPKKYRKYRELRETLKH